MPTPPTTTPPGSDLEGVERLKDQGRVMVHIKVYDYESEQESLITFGWNKNYETLEQLNYTMTGAFGALTQLMESL